MSAEAPAWTCPACGYAPTSEAEQARHEQGLDEQHLACAHQDIDAIKAEQLTPRNTFNGQAWG